MQSAASRMKPYLVIPYSKTVTSHNDVIIIEQCDCDLLKYDACDDVVHHYPIVTARLLLPYCEDNRTNDWLPCCVAEMDRYRRMG